MRRSSAGYIRTLDEGEEEEDEYYHGYSSPTGGGSTKKSWTKRLSLKKKKKKTSEKPLLIQAVSSSEDAENAAVTTATTGRPKDKERHHGGAQKVVHDEQQETSEASSSCSSPAHSSLASLPEQRPRDDPSSLLVQQEQSPAATAASSSLDDQQVIKGVKKKLRASSTPKQRTTQQQRQAPSSFSIPVDTNPLLSSSTTQQRSPPSSQHAHAAAPANTANTTTTTTTTTTTGTLSTPLTTNTLVRTPPKESQQTKSSSSVVSTTTTDETILTKARAALSRPFGRSSLPPHMASNWVVQISPAEWDADEERWKYRILVQRRTVQQTALDDSIVTAFTWRSLADFLWLEQALRAEFHGALLLPLLSIAVGTPDVANFSQQDVDATLLKDWLHDVLNGIRGNGELVLTNQEEVDLMNSEAMEAFLYRNTGTSLLPSSPLRRSNVNASPLDDSFTSPQQNVDDDDNKESFVDSLWAKPFDCLPIDTLCDGGGGGGSWSEPKNRRTPDGKGGIPPLHKMACSSRALGDARSLEVQDSFADAFDPDPEPLQSSSLAIHSELLEAERDLVTSYRKAAMAAMDKGRMLIEEEIQSSTAWKRFAISLSALYSYEKDIEGLRVEETKQKKRPTYRKLGKTNVDELLRLMTKQKTERTVPALRGLDTMLSAYVGDLSAVNPAIKTYSEAIMQLTNLDEPLPLPGNGNSPKRRSASSTSTKESWQDQVRTMANKFTGDSVKTESTSTTAATTDAEGSMNQKRAFEARVLKNERLLRDSLTALCRATPIRVARMAWKSFTTEAAQAALLKSSAHSMRTKVNILDRKALADMIERHKKESIEDAKAELDLVQRIITIEDYKKVPGSGDSVSTDGEEDDAFNDDKRQALLRSEAMELVRARVGRWDSKVGLAIMKAVGAEEGEVRVDETTRELRIVRKFAIGLREQLGRCREALNVLKGVIYYGDPEALLVCEEDQPDQSSFLRDTRQQFVDDITDVFSGALMTGSTPKPKSASTSMSVLSKAGIELEDPAGWSSAIIPASKSSSKRKIVPRKRRGRCGELTVQYTDLKNSATEKLLETLSDMLDKYQQRLENIESYVYMQCVGIQLEKHFSQQRSESLLAFEKKTDIAQAIGIAQRKKLPMLVTELEAKMAMVGNVTHTDVKKLKEIHLVSKTLKAELSALATRRFLRLRDTSTERVIGLMTVWAQHEEDAATKEVRALGELIAEIERQFVNVDMNGDGISHAFFGKSARRNS